MEVCMDRLMAGQKIFKIDWKIEEQMDTTRRDGWTHTHTHTQEQTDRKRNRWMDRKTNTQNRPWHTEVENNSCVNEIEPWGSSIKCQSFASSVCGEHLATIVIGNGKQWIKVMNTLAFLSLVKTSYCSFFNCSVNGMKKSLVFSKLGSLKGTTYCRQGVRTCL